MGAKENCACSSTDRASDYGSEGWGFESLQAHQMRVGLTETRQIKLLSRFLHEKPCDVILREFISVPSKSIVNQNKVFEPIHDLSSKTHRHFETPKHIGVQACEIGSSKGS